VKSLITNLSIPSLTARNLSSSCGTLSRIRRVSRDRRLWEVKIASSLLTGWSTRPSEEKSLGVYLHKTTQYTTNSKKAIIVSKATKRHYAQCMRALYNHKGRFRKCYTGGFWAGTGRQLRKVRKWQDQADCFRREHRRREKLSHNSRQSGAADNQWRRY